MSTIAPKLLEAAKLGAESGITTPVIIAFLDEAYERILGKQPVTVDGEMVLEHLVEPTPSWTEERIEAAHGKTVSCTASDGHVLGVAVVPRDPWLELLRDEHDLSDLPVTRCKMTVCFLDRRYGADEPDIRQFSPEEFADLVERVKAAANRAPMAN